jgi:hypothetical protein
VAWLMPKYSKTPLSPRCFLEPISKSFEEDEEVGELHEAKEVLRIKLPADKNPTLPLYPGEEAFDQPAPGISPSRRPSCVARLRRLDRCGATISMPSLRNSSSSGSPS